MKINLEQKESYKWSNRIIIKSCLLKRKTGYSESTKQSASIQYNSLLGYSKNQKLMSIRWVSFQLKSFFFVIFEHAECNNLLLLLLISRFNVWKPLQMVHSATTFLLKTTKAQISRVEYYCTTKTKLEKQKWLLWLFSVLLQQQ